MEEMKKFEVRGKGRNANGKGRSGELARPGGEMGKGRNGKGAKPKWKRGQKRGKMGSGKWEGDEMGKG
jgi:hypothetical protein